MMIKEYLLGFENNIEGLREFVHVVGSFLNEEAYNIGLRNPAIAFQYTKELLSNPDLQSIPKVQAIQEEFKSLLGVKMTEDHLKAIEKMMKEDGSLSIDFGGLDKDINLSLKHNAQNNTLEASFENIKSVEEWEKIKNSGALQTERICFYAVLLFH